MAAKTTGTGCEARMRATIWDRWRLCGKPVKGALAAGTPVCGIHLSVERKKIERDEEYHRQERLQARLREAAKIACSDLADVGIKATPEVRRWHSSGAGGYTGMVVTSPSEILEAIHRTHPK